MFIVFTVSAMTIVIPVIIPIVNNFRGRDHFNRLFYYSRYFYNWLFKDLLFCYNARHVDPVPH